MGEGDAEGSFQGTGGVEDVLLMDGLDELGEGLADFGRDGAECSPPSHRPMVDR